MDHAPIVAERFDSACRAHYFCVMSVAYNDLRRRVRRTVTFEACLPRKAKELPSGPAWIYEKSSMMASGSWRRRTLPAFASSHAMVMISPTGIR